MTAVLQDFAVKYSERSIDGAVCDIDICRPMALSVNWRGYLTTLINYKNKKHEFETLFDRNRCFSISSTGRCTTGGITEEKEDKEEKAVADTNYPSGRRGKGRKRRRGRPLSEGHW